MARKKTNIVRPSGVVQSQDGSRFYVKCNTTGKIGFIVKERFDKLLAKFGSEDMLVSGFTLGKRGRPKKESTENVDEATQKSPKKKAIHNAPHKRKAEEKPTVTQLEQAQKNEKEKEKVVYPWQSDPNYFRAKATPINYKEATKDSCFRADLYLDTQCVGCPLYEVCSLPTKYTEEDWKKKVNRSREADVVKRRVVVYS